MVTVPQLSFTGYGDVPSLFLDEVREAIEGCYKKLDPSRPAAVELRLIDTVERLRGVLEREKAELGIDTGGEDDFLSSHDAWRGVPRITLCWERIAGLPRLTWLGALRHEVAHTILHGAIEYYVFKISPQLLAAARERGLDLPLLKQILYHISIAVKDYEATSLLVKHGYDECQVALALHQLAVTDEDRAAWLLARRDPGTKLLYLVAQFKPILFAQPLRQLPHFRESLESAIEKMLEHLPLEEREELLALAERVMARLGQDTGQNIDTALSIVLNSKS